MLVILALDDMQTATQSISSKPTSHAATRRAWNANLWSLPPSKSCANIKARSTVVTCLVQSGGRPSMCPSTSRHAHGTSQPLLSAASRMDFSGCTAAHCDCQAMAWQHLSLVVMWGGPLLPMVRACCQLSCACWLQYSSSQETRDGPAGQGITIGGPNNMLSRFQPRNPNARHVAAATQVETTF